MAMAVTQNPFVNENKCDRECKGTGGNKSISDNSGRRKGLFYWGAVQASAYQRKHKQSFVCGIPLETSNFFLHN